LWRGLFDDVIRLLAWQPSPPDQLGLKVSILTLRATAYLRLDQPQKAEAQLVEAERICASSTDPTCGETLQTRGLVFQENGQFNEARAAFQSSLSFARAHNDRYLEASALLNVGDSFLEQEHFDEAIKWSQTAYDASVSLGANDIVLAAENNVGWANYKLGDLESALQVFEATEKRARQSGDIFTQENELTNIGYVYMDWRKFDLAAQSFQEALGLARKIKASQHIYNALRVIARFSMLTGDISKAGEFAQQALEIARRDKNRCGELYPRLVQAELAVWRGDSGEADTTFREIGDATNCPVFLKLESEYDRALLYATERHLIDADRQFRAALATFEGARDSVRRSNLSFFTNASRIYDDYVHFLVAQDRSADALRWADYSRARTLAEGLGALPKGPSNEPPPWNVQGIARRAGGTLLFYWLGEKQSFLWVITERKTSRFPLPPAAVIETVVERYRNALGSGPVDVLESANDDGLALYRMLVAPAQSLLPKDAKVFVLPDGALNQLNFETLLVSTPKVHCWIEDATIATASSLRILGASLSASPRTKRESNLLLIGNNIPPNDKYPSLPRATAQMETVAGHFAPDHRRIFARTAAIPNAYLNSKPEKFAYIHFVAHGVASRLSPLDSAIVLSNDSAASDSFKLYARDIVTHPLHADLVTISACYSAGGRAYSGEGLVGLSWAFLRAGAHNVVAALWQVTDVATEPLMAKFYDELENGVSPEVALRDAKLSLLRGSVFRNPYYWAPFQLYTQGRSVNLRYAEDPTARKTGALVSDSRSRPSTSTLAPGLWNRTEAWPQQVIRARRGESRAEEGLALKTSGRARQPLPGRPVSRSGTAGLLHFRPR
jgi:CHAT domain-containing protein/Tfp pilus assembly protein PilF